MTGRVSLVPGVTGLFVDLGQPPTGFVDALHLPRSADQWPAVGTVTDFEVLQLIWELRDEHDTGCRRTGGGSEASDYVVRQKTQWSPAPSVGVETVTLLATDGAGSVVFTAEVPRPPE